MITPESKVYVAGHRGLVGSALVRALEGRGLSSVLTRIRQQLDLQDGAAVRDFFERERPEFVFLAAAKVGGIWANSQQPVEFLLENLRIQNNIIESAYQCGVKKLLFLGSSCIYPKFAPQPIREDALLSGLLEPTNEPYAIAKIAGIKLCQAYCTEYGAKFLSVMPTNLYGPNDNFDLTSSHVLPALLRKFHEAKRNGQADVEIWGSGSPYREFLHVDDLADACLFLMERYDSPEIVNIGTGTDLTIRELAETIQRVVGFEGQLRFDPSKPDGTPRKQLDVSRLTGLGWTAKIPLEEGIRQTYRWYLEQKAESV